VNRIDSSRRRDSSAGVTGFYEKVVKVKADVAAILIKLILFRDA
jgi:hypothetical protein